jgi:hypothetical protein
VTKTNDTYFTLAQARHTGNVKLLHEASLSRVWQHVQNAKDKGFAILTSWRVSNSLEVNIENFALLRGQLREKGLGFFEVEGRWKECQDPSVSYEDCPEDQLKDTKEPSLFVIGITPEFLSALLDRYEQDAGVYAGPETDGRITLIFKDGSTSDLGDFTPGNLSQAFSQLKRKKSKTFHFEGMSWPAQTFFENLIEQQVRKK